MLALGSAGMARELFIIPARDMSLVRVGICMLLILGPAAAWLWVRARNPVGSMQDEGSSPSSVSRLP